MKIFEQKQYNLKSHSFTYGAKDYICLQPKSAHFGRMDMGEEV